MKTYFSHPNSAIYSTQLITASANSLLFIVNLFSLDLIARRMQYIFEKSALAACDSWRVEIKFFWTSNVWAGDPTKWKNISSFNSWYFIVVSCEMYAYIGWGERRNNLISMETQEMKWKIGESFLVILRWDIGDLKILLNLNRYLFNQNQIWKI